MRYLLIIFLLLVSEVSFSQGGLLSTLAGRKKSIFGWHGQSNATGAAISGEASDLTSKNINAYISNLISGNWEQYQILVNSMGTPSDWTDIQSWGGEARFLRELTDTYNAPPYLHKFTWPGSSIVDDGSSYPNWQPGVTGSKGLLQRAHDSYTSFAAKLPSGYKMKGIFWIQGEANVLDPPGYIPKITNQIAIERTFYSDATLPYIIVSLSTQQIMMPADKILEFKQMQRDISEYVYDAASGVLSRKAVTGNVIANVWCIDQNEPVRDQGGGVLIHYTTQGNDNIGRYCASVAKLILK